MEVLPGIDGRVTLMLTSEEHMALVLALTSAVVSVAVASHDVVGAEPGLPAELDVQVGILRELSSSGSWEDAALRDFNPEHAEPLCRVLGEFAARTAKVTGLVGEGAVHPVLVGYRSLGLVASGLAQAMAAACSPPCPGTTGDA